MLKARHHYVPQSHLRRFSGDGKKLWVFDKPTMQAFRASVRDVAQQQNYYRLRPKSSEGCPTATDLAEEVFSEVEAEVSPIIDEIVCVVRRGGRVSEKVRAPLSEYLALQCLRVPGVRSSYVQAHQKVLNAVKDLYMMHKMPDVDPSKYRVDLGPGGAQATHLSGVFDEKTIRTIVAHMRRHIWLFRHNEVEAPLYTSDAPLALIPCPEAPDIPVGFGSWGASVAVPLSSDVLLTMHDRRYYRDLEPIDSCTTPFREGEATFYNSIQVYYSTRQVYCERDDFAVARDVCGRFAEICDPDRGAFDVVGWDGSTPRALNRETNLGQ